MQNQPDILCLQEIPHAPNLSHLLNTHIYINITNDHTNGTAIIIHSSLSPYTTTIKQNQDLMASQGVNQASGADTYQKEITHKRQNVVQGTNLMRYFEHLLEGLMAGNPANCWLNRKVSFLCEIKVVEVNSEQRV